MSDVVMPRLSDSMMEGTIVRWLKADGDEVKKGEEIVEIETDKATIGYEVDDGGTLRILAEEGASLPVGAVIATVGDGDLASGHSTTPSRLTFAAPSQPPPTGFGVVDPVVVGAAGASPVARRVASRLGIELSSIAGSGPFGRIMKRDVVGAVGNGPRADGALASVSRSPAVSAAPTPPAALIRRPGAASAVATLEPTTRTQQLIAQRMLESRASVPEFHVEIDVDMTAVAELRQQFTQLSDAPPSINDVIVKAAAVALRRHPRINGSYRDGDYEFHRSVNIGIAVATESSLVVPTIRDADAKSLGAIATEARNLVASARSGRITPVELEGATFTVSNLGMFAITRFEAIIAIPQAAILSAGAIIDRPVARGGEVVTRPMMSLTLTCDHRIVYGAHAAAFLAELRDLLERPLTIAL